MALSSSLQMIVLADDVAARPSPRRPPARGEAVARACPEARRSLCRVPNHRRTPATAPPGLPYRRGPGPGSGLSGEGTGAAKDGAGRGSETMARGGISPYPGPGGAGNGTTGKPAMSGVSVSGGSNIVTLPSFAGEGAGPNASTRSSSGKDHEGPGITVVGSARSGGAFNFYGKLIGDKNYTIYIDTVLGTAVMQYADPASATHPYAEDLVAPQPMRSDLPANLKPSRLVIACILDRSGSLRNLQVLEPGRADMTTKVLAALTSWKFRPVFRGDQPVEVNAILGFDIDTR